MVKVRDQVGRPHASQTWVGVRGEGALFGQQQESCQADREAGQSGGLSAAGRCCCRRCDAKPELRRAVESELGRGSTSCTISTSGGGGGGGGGWHLQQLPGPAL